MKKTDRRIAKTKKAFQEALLTLLREKELTEITIRELCELADVSRMSFYYHYETIFELYSEMESDFISKFKSIYNASENHNYAEASIALMKFFRENATATRYFAIKSKTQFHTVFAKILEEQFTEIVKFEMQVSELSEHTSYMISYHSAGIYAVYMKWILDNFSWQEEKILELIHAIDEACDHLY